MEGVVRRQVEFVMQELICLRDETAIVGVLKVDIDVASERAAHLFDIVSSSNSRFLVLFHQRQLQCGEVRLPGCRVCLCKEADERRSVEIKHLCPRELAVFQAVKPQDFSFEAVSCRTEASLHANRD